MERSGSQFALSEVCESGAMPNLNPLRAIVLCVIIGLTSACGPEVTPTPLPPRAIRVDYPIIPPDVPMIDQDGRPAKLSDFRGRLVLIFFGNIRCREWCVDALPHFQAVKQALGERSAEVAFVMVGADRVADGPAVLKQHLGRYDPSFVGLTAE